MADYDDSMLGSAGYGGDGDAGHASSSDAGGGGGGGGGHQEETGTIWSTSLNTVCNIMGAGVLSLPLATYNSSLPFAMFILVIFFVSCTYSAYVIVIGCEVKQRFSLGTLLSAVLLREGPPSLASPLSSSPPSHL